MNDRRSGHVHHHVTAHEAWRGRPGLFGLSGPSETTWIAYGLQIASVLTVVVPGGPREQRS